MTPVADTALSVASLSKTYRLPGGRQREGKTSEKVHRAVNAVSLDLPRGEILGLAGGSGSGKTTLARCVVRLTEADSGSVLLGDIDVLQSRGKALRDLRRRLQMVFQDPYSSLNPRLTVSRALIEVGSVHRRPGASDQDKFVADLLDKVRLPASLSERRPRELSGGQRQRVAIARALAAGPDVLIADEAVSALDVSVQAQLLQLFRDLRDELGLSIIFVAHQLAVLAEIADRIAVMSQGRIVEVNETRELIRHPQHEYTRALLGAHPHADPSKRLRAD